MPLHNWRNQADSYPMDPRRHGASAHRVRVADHEPREGATFADVEPTGKKDGRRREGSRPLDPWERYRALNDATDEAYDLMDMSNREARFALIVMGTLNAFVVIAASRTEVVEALDARQRLWAASLLGIYAITAVYFLFQAIEALRPGKFRPHLGDWNPSAEDYPMRVRYYEDVIQRDVQAHWKVWTEVHVTQLNSELAIQLHSLSVKSNVKRVALGRLFAGLRVMTLMVTGLLVLFVYAIWV